MQNLQGTQADRDAYLDQDILTPEGSLKYVSLYMSGKAPDETTGKPKGIPAEDFNNFATAVFLLRDYDAEFAEKRLAGEKIRHIDSGTGPNIYTVIAALGHVDESIAVELAPSNIQTLENYKDPEKELPAFWNAWLELAVLLHDLGGPDALLAIDKDIAIPELELAGEPDLVPDEQGRINLYDSLRKWPLLSDDTKSKISEVIYRETGAEKDSNNPYKAMQREGLQQVLARKLTVRQGDLFNPLGDDRVPAITDLAGTAHFNTSVYVTESNTRKLPFVLHAEANKVQFSRKDGLWMSCHMAGTEGYNGFITEEQLAENPDMEHEECPMSQGLLRTAMGEIVAQDPRYLGLSAEPVSEERRMVRPGKEYSQSVIVAGRVNHLNEHGQPKFDNGVDFMNHLRQRVLTARHTMHYTDREAPQAVKDFRSRAERFAKSVGPLGNGGYDWDRLNRRFWDKYSQINFDMPIPGDIEGMFGFIENLRGKKGGTYLDVGTGSAPEFAIAAVAAGMGKVIVSDHAEGALSWLKEELLDENPLSSRAEMWLDIAKLLSTFKNKDELLAYCHETGFDMDLRQWQTLPQAQKDIWFNERRSLMSRGKGAEPWDSFLDNDVDIKAKIRQMHEEGDFEIRKFSILNPPKDLLGKADIVTANSVASCISEKASEYCQTILNICRLAKEDGTISTSYTPYDNWKQYTADAGELPSIPRHNHYYSVAHAMVLASHETPEEQLRHNPEEKFDQLVIAKERATVKREAMKAAMTFEGTDQPSLRKPGDNRFEHLIHISGQPKRELYKSGEEMLRVFQMRMLGKAQAFLLEHPYSHNIMVDPTLFRNVGELEQQLGMKPQTMHLPQSQQDRREMLADRLEGIIDHLETRQVDVETMDKQDKPINQFVDRIYERLVGRGTHIPMLTDTAAYAARR